ncbi:unnamed protein product, partial [Protopolystoma xenopodis]
MPAKVLGVHKVNGLIVEIITNTMAKDALSVPNTAPFDIELSFIGSHGHELEAVDSLDFSARILSEKALGVRIDPTITGTHLYSPLVLDPQPEKALGVRIDSTITGTHLYSPLVLDPQPE